jgi:hypothetical protein
MSDERELFQRAAREMRPEFHARLTELLDIVDTPSAPESSPRGQADPVTVVELARAVPTQRRRRHGWLLVAAASVPVLIGLVALTRGSADVHVQAPDLAVESSPRPSCAGSAGGVAGTGSGSIAVFVLDGGGFCMSVGNDALTVGSGTSVDPTSDPVVIDSGPIEAVGGWFYVFAIPERLPVNVVVDDEGRAATTFTNPVGRRLLIIEYDVDDGAPMVDRTWELSTGDGRPFGSITAQGPVRSADATVGTGG